jgi:hypothetical protein
VFFPLPPVLIPAAPVKTLAIRNSAEELMISRRAQLKGQDQKVSSSLTDDFTMRNFIAVSAWLPPYSKLGISSLMSFYPGKNPSFMQDTAYEPLTLNIPLLGRPAEEASHNSEPIVDSIVTEMDERASLPEVRQPTTEEDPPFKKRRTIRFVE